MAFVLSLFLISTSFSVSEGCLSRVSHFLCIFTCHMRKLYLSHRRPAKAQASLRLSAASPEPLLFTHVQQIL